MYDLNGVDDVRQVSQWAFAIFPPLRDRNLV